MFTVTQLASGRAKIWSQSAGFHSLCTTNPAGDFNPQVAIHVTLDSSPPLRAKDKREATDGLQTDPPIGLLIHSAFVSLSYNVKVGGLGLSKFCLLHFLQVSASCLSPLILKHR